MVNTNLIDFAIETLVKQAANDYCYAKILLEEYPDDHKAMALKTVCEKLFQSESFNKLTGLNGFDILSKLDQEGIRSCF